MKKLLAILLAMSSSATAHAACSTRDIAGTWRIVGMGVLQDGAGETLSEPIIFNCRLTWSRAGKLLRSHCWEQSRVSSMLDTPDVVAWSHAIVGGSCWVNITLGDPFDGFNLYGQMSGNIIIGVGTMYDNPGFLNFQMIK